MYIPKRSGMDHAANTRCLHFLRKRSRAAADKNVLLFEFCTGCMRLTGVTRYEVRYDSDRVTDVAKNLGVGGLLVRSVQHRGKTLN